MNKQLSSGALVKLRHLINTTLIPYFINHSPLITSHYALLPTTIYPVDNFFDY